MICPLHTDGTVISDRPRERLIVFIFPQFHFFSIDFHLFHFCSETELNLRSKEVHLEFINQSEETVIALVFIRVLFLAVLT